MESFHTPKKITSAGAKRYYFTTEGAIRYFHTSDTVFDCVAINVTNAYKKYEKWKG